MCPHARRATSSPATKCAWKRCASRVRIINQILDNLPAGPVNVDDRKIALPPRTELYTSMEAVIHHFKLVTEGIKPPVGEAYAAVESPKGEIGFFIASDGSTKPYRVRIRAPVIRQPAGPAQDVRGADDRRHGGDHRLYRYRAR